MILAAYDLVELTTSSRTDLTASIFPELNFALFVFTTLLLSFFPRNF